MLATYVLGNMVMLLDPDILNPFPFIIWKLIGPKFLADDGHVNVLTVRVTLVPEFRLEELVLWYMVTRPVELM